MSVVSHNIHLVAMYPVLLLIPHQKGQSALDVHFETIVGLKIWPVPYFCSWFYENPQICSDLRAIQRYYRTWRDGHIRYNIITRVIEQVALRPNGDYIVINKGNVDELEASLALIALRRTGC